MSKKDYETYVKKYSQQHGITKQEAEKHALVKEVKKQCEQKDNSVKVVGWKEV